MQKPMQIAKPSSGSDRYLLWFICVPVLCLRQIFLVVATLLRLLPIAPAKLRTSGGVAVLEIVYTFEFLC